jgi:gamma-glutamylcyclotransferase (GGCT)/AIG2-like uncharacterized protein YtfP
LTELIFVYGTLRRGYSRHVALQRLGAEYLDRGTIQGELFELGDFPGAGSTAKASSRIVGEIYRLPDPSQALPVLDEIEGLRPAAPELSLFRRAMTTVTLENGQETTAWVYWLNRSTGPRRRIPSGDYAAH